MRKEILLFGAVFAMIGAGSGLPGDAQADEFDRLKENQELASFRVEAIYENEAGKAMGARFRHHPTRYVLDVLRIQSIPQAFMWVNSLPPSDQGEPHTLEHLLLGKGTKGRFVASLEEMSLGRSSAFTQQRRTCYHFSTEAGKEVFFDLYEAKLDAMLNPNYSDEEIRREVCNMGIVEDQEDGSLWLEEKGTVYSEMVSSFERPWGNLYRKIRQMAYGEGHPLALSSGGLPAAIREMTPEDLRNFHGTTHHLNNMGAVVSIGNDITLEECLDRLSGVLSRVEPGAVAGEDPASLWERIPVSDPDPVGGIALTQFPHQNENEPGLMVFTWPPAFEMNAQEEAVLELFLSLLASGNTSNLYRKFIDSQTREMDIGASSIFFWPDEQPGHLFFLAFGNVSPDACTEETIDAVRALVLREIESVASMEDGSEGLRAFNRRAENWIIQARRDTREFLNSPPRFGYRGSGSAWINHLQRLHRRGGFRRNLAGVEEFEAIRQLLATDGNFWADHIARWKLLETLPYGAATTAGPEMLAASESAREERIRSFVDGLKRDFPVETDGEAVDRYREGYDEKTALIDTEAATIEMPVFVSSPPLSLDEELDYEIVEFPGGGTLVASTFENMTSGTVGFAFGLDVIDEPDLVYVAALPTLLREVGVIRDGEPIPYDAFDERLRREILSLDVYLTTNYRTERVELALRGAGSELAETQTAVEWMGVSLFTPDLRPQNLPRIRDAVNLALKSARNRMRGREESWVNTPVYAYWKQHNPLLLNAGCFLTQSHALHRLRWLLMEGDPRAFSEFSTQIAQMAREQDREGLTAALSALVDGETAPGVDLSAMNEETARLCRDAAEDIRSTLTEIPDAALSDDVGYLCRQMAGDLAVSPEDVLTDIESVLDRIRHRDNFRSFVISNSRERRALMPAMETIIARLDQSPSGRVRYGASPLVDSRVGQRGEAAEGPVFVALVNESTRSGVHIHTADCASYETTDSEALLRFLAARLYGGGGAHSMFMKTWGAGLAYSNGLRSNESYGRLTYYAERCPDLAQTLQFVVGELEKAAFDAALAEYAVAQAFGGNRSGARYEQRGEAMAADLADGIDPEVVTRFRRGILDLREDPDLPPKLHEMMNEVYGEVLPGLGPSGKEAAADGNAIYYVIGPDKQLQSWGDYLQRVEPGARLLRIYPRDYWQTRPDSQ